MTYHSICVFSECVCVCFNLPLCTALYVWERESERRHCCICSSLKGANEHTCVPPGLLEWGVDEGLAFPSSYIVKMVSRQTGVLDPQTLIWQQFGSSFSNDEGDVLQQHCWARLWLYLEKNRYTIANRGHEKSQGNVCEYYPCSFYHASTSFWTFEHSS